MTVTKHGNGFLPATSPATWAVAIPELDTVASGDFTVNWYGVVRTNVQGILLNSVGPTYGWFFYIAAAGANAIQLQMFHKWRGFAIASNVSTVDKALHALGARFDATSGEVQFFVDGARAGAPIWWGSEGGAIGPSQTFGMYDDSGGAAPQQMITVQAVNGMLSDEQMRAWAENPWIAFEPEDDDINSTAASADAAVLEGNAQATASATGTLATQIQLAGTAQSQAAASASLTAQISLSADAVSISTANGVLTAQIKLSASALSQAISSAALSSGINLSASAVAEASADGMLDTIIQLIGTAVATASASGDLSTGISGALEAHAVASATASGNLTAQILLGAIAVAQPSASVDLTSSINLEATTRAVAVTNAALSVSIQLTATAIAQAIATGSLTAQIQLSGCAVAQALATAALDAQVELSSNPRYMAHGRKRNGVSAASRRGYTAGITIH
ncbi:hypothetical protein [Nitrosospira sp. Nsp1]|uniref:hypothetical protein n=1 Tax=Nitrosospira sp. Nsp1 TaxID=136547 RepID=UPI00115F81AD|nr:hypothetical protein [Nitrosospira sp. Nsp1]